LPDPDPAARVAKTAGCRRRRCRTDNGKPVARRGRKATGLLQVAGLPKPEVNRMVPTAGRVRTIAQAVLALAGVYAALLAASANFKG